MTAVLAPDESRQPSTRRTLRDWLRAFDFLDWIGTHLADVAGVTRASASVGAPRLDCDLVKRVGVAIYRKPHQHPLLIAFAIALIAFSVAVVALLATGGLDDVYESIWRRIPGRPWTHVMRDHPWGYLVLTVPLGAVPYVLAPPQRWGRAFLTYVIFLIGFLGGHVFW